MTPATLLNEQREIDLTNVGAIDKLTIPMPSGGGVVVLRGPNGSGKSTGLNAASALIGGDADIAKRDGTDRAIIEGLGAKLTIGQRKSRACGSEVEVRTIEGQLDLAALVDPGISDPFAADKHRIRALVDLSGVTADIARFSVLPCGMEELTTIAASRTRSCKNLIDMAATIKLDLEEEARKAAAEALRAESLAQAMVTQAGTVDPLVETDEQVLQGHLERAIANKSKVDADRANADKIIADAKSCQVQIDAVNANPMASLETAKLLHDTAKQDYIDACATVSAAKEALRKAETECSQAEATWNAKRLALTTAEQHDASMKQWQASVDRAKSVERPTDEAVSAAVADVTSARHDMESGAIARAALANLAEAKKHDERASKLRQRETVMRQSAIATDQVLSEAVKHPRLKVVGGRLVIDTDRSPVEPFAELSPGNRWKVAIDLAVDRIGDNGFLVIPQEAWEGLDGRNRRMIAEHAKAVGVVILTAEASRVESDQELHVVEYQ
jgi:energy-coupling factor transporter ATP-binding protein EcfA2